MRLTPLRVIPVFTVVATVLLASFLEGEVVDVGSGSYTLSFPGVDVAGRNGVPPGLPQVSGAAVGRPVPTNDWWSALLNRDHASNLFNYPFSMRTLPSGLDIGLVIPASGVNGSSQPLSEVSPIVVGVSGLSASRATVSDYSDWTVTASWRSSGHEFDAKMGMGMPFVYFRKGTGDEAVVTVNVGDASIAGERLLIENSQGGSSFVVYGPSGSEWSQSGNTYSSDLAGANYWSILMVPKGYTAANAELWSQHAYVEPVDTAVSWNYDAAQSVLRTTYTTLVEVHEGSGKRVLQGLLPHQWAHLSDGGADLTGASLSTIRGELKLMASNTFSTERTFHGILPTLPAVGVMDPGFDPTRMANKINQMEDESLATWTDSYNEGQVMNRLIQTARIAHELGMDDSLNKILDTVKGRLEDWLSAEAGEVAFLFHYQSAWSTLIGYPAGHGQDNNINDHHFHWGYFIHAAAFVEQFEPGWAEQWGGMIDLLIRDAASADRADPMFPFLRSFSPFAGHAWANGFATFPFGNDQESSSESMQFNTALIHWGALTGNDEIRDLGIYLYTTEQSAIEEYWFDVNERTFKPGYGYSLASRIWGNGYDNQTFWTSDIAAAYGIELYPIHGGSLYLGHNSAYAERLWSEMAANTGVLNQVANDNLWHDTYWKFLAFTDPGLAIELYEANPGRDLKFGISDAQTYHWLYAMNVLGRIDTEVVADDPLAVAFKKDGERIYVAHNYHDQSRTVNFSDGTELQVPAGSMATSLDLPFEGTLSTPFPIAPMGNSIPLELMLSGNTEGLVSVEFVSEGEVIEILYGEPFKVQTDALPAGMHRFYARLNEVDGFSLTNHVSVLVGESFPYGGLPAQIPGTIEAGEYDRIEGALGQGITYNDVSVGNNGDFRVAESVDAFSDPVEGNVVGWISDGEWLEYSVDIAEDGVYAMDFRYASGNQAGGGPFRVELDGAIVSPSMRVSYTGDWADYESATLAGVELRKGRHQLRVHFEGGELNLGRLTFAYTEPLGYEPPVANAGEDIVVGDSGVSILLDGSASTVASGSALSWDWEQLAGPSVVEFFSFTNAQVNVSGLEEDGVYYFRLTVDDGQYQDFDDVLVRRGAIASIPPTISLLGPTAGDAVLAGYPLNIVVEARDFDGEVVRVDFYNGDIYLGSSGTDPFSLEWYPPVGSHELRAEVVDNDGLVSSSSTISLTANEPVPCLQSSDSGDFEYLFESGSAGTSMTFIPSRSGVGANIVLFYYGSGSGPLPGQVITPNVPFMLNSGDGETIRFYFTYSVPEGGERNTIAENLTYRIGSCGSLVPDDQVAAVADWREAQFGQEALADETLEDSLWGAVADPDGDGISNAWEYASGGDPLVSEPFPLQVLIDVETQEIRIRANRRLVIDSPAFAIEWSTDLETWMTLQTAAQPVSQVGDLLTEEFVVDGYDSSQPIFLRVVDDEISY